MNLRKSIDDIRAESGRLHKSGHTMTRLAWDRVDDLKAHQANCPVCTPEVA